MKSNQSFLTYLLALCLCMVSGTVDAGFTKNIPAFGIDKVVAYHPSAFIFQSTDTVPAKTDNSKAVQKAAKDLVPKVELPKMPKLQAPKAPKVDNNLFKKIAEAFKFRKHSLEAEQKRVVAIFEKLGINDSIAASAENVRMLLDELSIRENQHYDSLIAIISEIKNRKPEKEYPAIPPPVNADESIEPEPSESKIVTDKDIEDLTNKMLPLIAERANETKSSKDKRVALSALRKVRNGSSEIYFSTDTAKGIVKRFTLKVKNRAEVYGIHNFNRNGNFDDYKFSFLNTILYNSLFVNGKTGNVKDLNGWDTASIVTNAQKSGCKVVFTASIQQASSTESFLASIRTQKAFVENAIFLLKLRKAQGVNIQFDGVHSGNKAAFTQFIKFLSEVLKIQDNSYQVLVTVPAYQNTDGYDLKVLSEFADRFMVNFSSINTGSFGPMTPLKGNKYSMETVLSRFLNEDVPPQKLIASVSYVGTKWAQPGGKFIQPLTFAEIRRRYDWPVYYDDESASAVMDSLNKIQSAVRTIFFDDAVSLEKKYDYIIENGLGGVTIDALGYDRGYGELWDALSYKFAIIDTLYLKDSIIGKPLNLDLSWMEKASRYLTLFGYVLNNPCEVCFENIPDTAYYQEITRDLQELKIDSLIVAKNKTLPLKDKIRSKFEYVNGLLSTCLAYITFFVLLITLIGAGFYLYKIKSESQEWALKKKAEIILIGLSILLVLCTFTFLFTSDTIPIFGATPKKTNNGSTIGFSKDVSRAMAADSAKNSTSDTTVAATVIISDSDPGFCNPDPNDKCINMPFPTLMIIIFLGMVIGFVITRYLIMPLLERNDIP